MYKVGISKSIIVHKVFISEELLWYAGHTQLYASTSISYVTLGKVINKLLVDRHMFYVSLA